MYFSEQGNVDDDATLITIFLVAFNLQSCCLMQSAVCKCYTPAIDLRRIKRVEENKLGPRRRRCLDILYS